MAQLNTFTKMYHRGNRFNKYAQIKMLFRTNPLEQNNPNNINEYDIGDWVFIFEDINLFKFGIIYRKDLENNMVYVKDANDNKFCKYDASRIYSYISTKKYKKLFKELKNNTKKIE